MFGLQRLLEQGISEQIDHFDGQLIAGAKPGIDKVQLLVGERVWRGGM
jgi:hypothetical protein